jgi:predicted AAA+ superfamily ATPase
MAIQVCWEIRDSTRPRELKGLAEALRSLKLKEGLILTYNQENEFNIEGRKVAAIPAWKWLLLPAGPQSAVKKSPS